MPQSIKGYRMTSW